jgi:predicted amidohydrolase
MKIAAAQIACALGDLEANLCTIHDFASRAKDNGAELIVFPEMVDTGYSMPAIQKHATVGNEGAVPRLQKMARQLSLAVIAGVSDRDGPRIHNGQVFIDAGGNIRARYRKTHLVTAAPLDERPVFTAGDAFVSCKFRHVQSRPNRFATTFVFRRSARALAVEHGANVFINSSAWPFPRP